MTGDASAPIRADKAVSEASCAAVAEKTTDGVEAEAKSGTSAAEDGAGTAIGVVESVMADADADADAAERDPSVDSERAPAMVRP